MRATVMYGAGDVRIENVPDAPPIEPTDALVVVNRAAICGSDLWPYNLMEPSETGSRIGTGDGAQAEALRVPQADGTLVVLPVGKDDALMPSFLTLTDVMGTGHHAAVAANVGPGKTAAVVGDGAVGLCGVMASRRVGVEQIILLGRHPDRIALAREFGATDVVSERGDEAVERVHELTDGFGVHSVLECVGTEQSMLTALSIVRPGGADGPHHITRGSSR
jgi:threonine dehydrogenase-like Zn-dependent dehydrogenase